MITTIDRYNPNNVGILEDYLYHQIRHEDYDCLANLAILKLYASCFDIERTHSSALQLPIQSRTLQSRCSH